MSFIPNDDDMMTAGDSRRGFTLVIVLVILTLLAVITVAYLSSMATERATANAFGNKARAEQAAQAGVDSAVGVLRDYFKAFPDSATAWDTAQSTNAPPAPNSASPPPNEGTSLYLRAVSKSSSANAPNTTTDTPVPFPVDPSVALNTSDSSTDPTSANYVSGNNPSNIAAAGGAYSTKIFVLPLVSGATVERLENKANSIRGANDPAAPGGSVKPLTIVNTVNAPANAVDLNARRSLGDTIGWLGTPPGYVNPQNTNGNILPKPCIVPWVEIKQSDNYPDPANAPVVGRYAFWVEDESFRANVSYADGRTDATGNVLPNDARRDNDPTSPAAKTSLNGTDLSLLGLFNFIGGGNPNTSRAYLLAARRAYPSKTFPESNAYAHAEGASATTNNSLRYLTTTQSAGLNLSRHGTQRLSLNAVVDQAVDPTNTTAIQKQFDTIVKTIQFHAPNFGQRFYRTSAAVTPAELNGAYVSSTSGQPYTQIYLAKVAANIRDYIDKDAFPTCVLPGDGSHPNGIVRGVGPQTLPIGDNSTGQAWALGKDSAPFMQECGARYRCDFDNSTTPATYLLKTDYYVEVWNMSNRDINLGDLGSAAFIRIGNPTQWFGCRNDSAVNKTKHRDLTTSDGNISPTKSRQPVTVPPSPQPNPRDFDIDISTCTFPAGTCTVVTTDPDYKDIITDTEARTHVFKRDFKSPGTRVYKGPVPLFSDPGVTPLVYCNALITVLEDSLNNTSDYRTDTVIGSELGHIDSLSGALFISYSGQIYFPYNGSGTPPQIYGGFLRGNWTNSGVLAEGKPASALGDPRTNNEQLKFDPSSTNSADKTRFTSYTQGGAGVYPTFGQLNYQSCRPNRPDNPWPDFPPLYSNSTTNSGTPALLPAELDLSTTAKALAKAPATIANGPLTSIGQLGDVFDPARIIYNSGTIQSSRGGGRSFKIGQHDDRWDGDETSASRGWTSWRLTDFLCVADPATQPLLADAYGITQPGLFNINGITRDNGAALRAALYGFNYQPAGNGGDPTLATSSNGSPANPQIDALVNQMVARLKTSPINTDGSVNTGTIQTGAGPFWERGEISELPLFGRTVDTAVATSSSDYATTALTGSEMSSKIFDRGREELVRRLVEMTTTRGSVYTVYAVGQSLQPDPGNASVRRVVGTHQLKVTFRLVPKGPLDTNTGRSPDFHPGIDSTGSSTDAGTAYDPNNNTQLAARFAKPDHYDIQIISASSGSN